LVINGITAVGASAGCRHIGPRSNVLPAPIEAHRHDVEPLVRAELRSVLSAAIDDLPASYRCVIVLRDIEGLSAPETSTTLQSQHPERQVAHAPRAVTPPPAVDRVHHPTCGHERRRRDGRAGRSGGLGRRKIGHL
jgi:hypothetical protein